MAWGRVPTPGTDHAYSVYASEAYLGGSDTRLRRFTYRLDGFVALRGGDQGGKLTTRPLTSFSADDCDPLEGDEIAKTVTWNTDGNGPFSGRPVRVQFQVKDADLFSFRFF